MIDVKFQSAYSPGHLLFCNERDRDVALNVEWEGRTYYFPGHSLILSTMSDVFRTMLTSDMVEANSRVITIRNTNPKTFKALLRYIYLGSVELNEWLAFAKLLELSHQYRVQPLVNICEKALIDRLGFSNVCTLYELSQTYALDDLKRESEFMILDAAFIVSATEDFYSLKERSMECILKHRWFNMECEASVLACLKEWATNECCRRCMKLTRENILLVMEPFLKYIIWRNIPQNERTFVPNHLVEKCNDITRFRRHFRFPASLRTRIKPLKFVVELGAFQPNYHIRIMDCLKFNVESHVFIAGFKIVGMFQMDFSFFENSSLILGREGSKTLLHFSFNSLPWTDGRKIGNYTWRELVAYFPYPIRVDPFSNYVFKINTSMLRARWPRTLQEKKVVYTDVGPLRFTSLSQCFGITQLFLLPASSSRKICNDSEL